MNASYSCQVHNQVGASPGFCETKFHGNRATTQLTLFGRLGSVFFSSQICARITHFVESEVTEITMLNIISPFRNDNIQRLDVALSVLCLVQVVWTILH